MWSALSARQSVARSSHIVGLVSILLGVRANIRGRLGVWPLGSITTVEIRFRYGSVDKYGSAPRHSACL
jgi:hypothetical protein